MEMLQGWRGPVLQGDPLPEVVKDAFCGATNFPPEVEDFDIVGADAGWFIFRKWLSAEFPERNTHGEFFYTYAWKAKIGKYFYGDFAELPNDAPGIRAELKAILLEQAEQSILAVLAKQAHDLQQPRR